MTSLRFDVLYGAEVVRPVLAVRIKPTPWRERLRVFLWRLVDYGVELLLWILLALSVAGTLGALSIPWWP